MQQNSDSQMVNENERCKWLRRLHSNRMAEVPKGRMMEGAESCMQHAWGWTLKVPEGWMMMDSGATEGEVAIRPRLEFGRAQRLDDE
jgi:hypothetical protein